MIKLHKRHWGLRSTRVRMNKRWWTIMDTSMGSSDLESQRLSGVWSSLHHNQSNKRSPTKRWKNRLCRHQIWLTMLVSKRVVCISSLIRSKVFPQSSLWEPYLIHHLNKRRTMPPLRTLKRCSPRIPMGSSGLIRHNFTSPSESWTRNMWSWSRQRFHKPSAVFFNVKMKLLPVKDVSKITRQRSCWRDSRHMLFTKR